MKFISSMLFLLCLTVSFGQQDESNANRPYENMSTAYRSLDSKLLSDSYTEKAVLLNLYDSSNPNSIKGNKEINAYFENFFQGFRQRGQTMSLSFKIIDRQKIEESIYDNGFYNLTIYTPDKPDYNSYGKLSTILVLDEGHWKFNIDSNSNTDKEEYDKAEVGELVQPKYE